MSVPEPVRKYLYSVLLPISALLVAYGIVDSNTVALWVGIAEALLGIGAVEAARSRVTPVKIRKISSTDV